MCNEITTITVNSDQIYFLLLDLMVLLVFLLFNIQVTDHTG